MQTTKMAVAVATALTAVSADAATRWDLDTSHTELGFKVRHLMVSYTRGRFGKFSGSLELDEKDLSKSKVSVKIDANSIDTNWKDRDDHLRSADFFDVEKFPQLTFESSKVEKAGDRLRITGDLTMHGITKKVVLDAEALTPVAKDPWGNLHIGTRATTKVNRKDFGLNWNKTLETGGVAVGDEVELSLEIEFVRKP